MTFPEAVGQKDMCEDICVGLHLPKAAWGRIQNQLGNSTTCKQDWDVSEQYIPSSMHSCKG
jgi:hypothetical protein